MACVDRRWRSRDGGQGARSIWSPTVTAFSQNYMLRLLLHELLLLRRLLPFNFICDTL
jgi:hypothetical protein